MKMATSMNLDFARNNNRDSDDLALGTEQYRFNKFSFPDFSIPPRGFKPLKDDDYPISGRVNDTLRLSNAYSVITADDYEVTLNMRSIIEAIGGLPKHPEPRTSSDFWDVSFNDNYSFIKMLRLIFVCVHISHHRILPHN